MTEDEVVGWHHQLNGLEFEHTLGDSEGQGSLVCCSPWGHKESDTAEKLNNNCAIEGTGHNNLNYINYEMIITIHLMTIHHLI